MSNEVQIVNVLPTLDEEFPQQVTARRNGEEFVVYTSKAKLLYHSTGHKVEVLLASDIAFALIQSADSLQTARRAARFAQLAELCRRFQ